MRGAPCHALQRVRTDRYGGPKRGHSGDSYCYGVFQAAATVAERDRDVFRRELYQCQCGVRLADADRGRTYATLNEAGSSHRIAAVR